jgi:hypothetical protein
LDWLSLPLLALEQWTGEKGSFNEPVVCRGNCRMR